MGSRGRSRSPRKHRNSGGASTVKTKPPRSEPEPADVNVDVDVTLKPSTATSAVSSSTARRRHTLRVGGFVALTTALKTTAFLSAVFYFFGGVLLFCVVSLGSFLLLLKSAAASEYDPESEMWTMTQFETLGALRVDTYVRYLVTKLAVLWRSIVSLHKTAVNYSFTVSIAETPSLVELQDLLDTRVPLLLTYDDAAATDDESYRSRGSSIASTVVMDGNDDVVVDIEEVEEYYAVEGYVPDYDDDDEWPEVEEEPVTQQEAGDVVLYSPKGKKAVKVVSTEVQPEDNQVEDDIIPVQTPEKEEVEDEAEPLLLDEKVDVAESTEEPVERVEQQEEAQTASYSTEVARGVVALQSIAVPLLPLLQAHSILASSSCAFSSATVCEPVVSPLVKPLIFNVKQTKWTPEAPVVKPVQSTQKRRISVCMPTMKPLPRLVVKARPSTLTPPENVQRMLNQVDRMMQEVHELLAIGNEVLGRSDDSESAHPTRRRGQKDTQVHVRFSDSVQLIESPSPADLGSEEDEEELRSSLHYLPEEIESMSDEYFRSSIDGDPALLALC